MQPYRDYDQSTLGRVLHVLTRSFAVGTFFGVHVRMYWVAAILMPLLFLRWTAPVSGTALEALVLVAICFFGLFAVIWSHEMGHIACGWRFRINTDLITLSPLGGVAHMNAPASRPREELLVSLAGPAVHLVWLAVFWPLQQLLPAQVLSIGGWRSCPIEFAVWYLVVLNGTLLAFNLLPIFPLDGGRVFRSLLSTRMHPNRATMWASTVGIAGGIGLIVFGLFGSSLQGVIPVVIGISCIMASLQERRAARHTLVYGQDRRQPWEADPDAWKRGADPVREPRARRPGWLARWRASRAEKRMRAKAAREAALDREVDKVLDRLHRVGMSGLSDKEKATLKRAAKRRRGVG